jgi:Glutathione synthase/Ribosomal protein S6 modification enzyme (glutaminyl transferase)
MILVCGGLADSLTELMCARLTDCGYDHRFLDLGVYPNGYKVKWHWKNLFVEGYIEGPGWKLDLDELTGVYTRYPGEEARMPPEGISKEVVPTMYFEYDTGLMSLFEDLPCPVINRSGGGMSNGSKPYQGLIVRESGLLTPPTLVTNDPRSAFQFYKECNGEVIYKSLSGIRSIVRRMGAEQLDRLDFLRNGPAQFQAFIPGKNIRVHTIGAEVFSTIVHSEAVDYRYARREGHDVNMEAFVLPPPIEEACLRLAKKLDLLLAGIDLKLTPDGKYYCFEINPSPAFLYYEQNSGQPISKAVAELLHTGPRTEFHHEKEFVMNR